MSPTIIPEGMSTEAVLGDLLNKISVDLGSKETEVQAIKKMAKDLEDASDRSGEIIRQYKDARANLKQNITVEGGIDTLKTLLIDAHEKVATENNKFNGVTDALTKMGKGIFQYAIKGIGGGDWLSFIPKLTAILDNCKTDLVSLRGSFDNILNSYKQGGEKAGQSLTQFRNEFKEKVINKMISLCKNVQTGFERYASHKISVEKVSLDGKVVDLTSAKRCLLSYIRVIGSYAGIKQLKPSANADPTVSMIFQPKEKRGPGGMFGYGIIALMFESLCNGMISRSANELKCKDMKDHIYRAYAKGAHI